MKRFACIVSCLLILLAGAVAAWADCTRVSFGKNDDARREKKHDHDHHSHSDHGHSHDSVIHCPTLDQFVPAATFSPSSVFRTGQAPLQLVPPALPDIIPGRFLRSHGPPGPVKTFRIPQHLSLSVLRV
jgi:hypothetical protein